MSIPIPPIDLQGHCSAVYDNVLYVLSPGGLQSLPIQKKAEWSKEPSGVSVTSPACVKVGNGTQSALYVIGGKTSDDGFSGLQRFTFATKKWETLTSTASDVIQGRTNHSVAYLEDSQSILVYAGSQPTAPSFLSSQTFLISTQPPHNIQSFTSDAPPSNLPILLPWDSTSAIMIGGGDYSTQPYLFNPYTGWQPYGTNLTQAPPTSARGTIIDGNDGSKVLELYDFSVSPNQVSQIVLQDASGQPAADGTTVGSSSSSSRRVKRDLTLNNWPQYNSTEAPTPTRPDCSVAQTDDEVAVIAGGSASQPIALFSQNDNSWIDASSFFDSKAQHPSKPSKSSSPSSTSSSHSSNLAAPISGSGKSHSQTLRMLGIILGVLFGIAAIFVLALLFIRYRKLKKRKKEGYLDEKNGERMSFQDRGASFMKEAGGSVTDLEPPDQINEDGNRASHSSLAIMAGKLGTKRGSYNHEPKSSYDSTAQLVRDKNVEAGEPVEMMNIGDKRSTGQLQAGSALTPQYGPTLTAQDAKDRRKRSSGWSKYFATSGPTGPNGLSHIPAAYVKPDGGAAESNSTFDPSTPRLPSTLLSSLDIDFGRTADGQRLSHVASGSPSFNDSREDLAKSGSSAHAAEGQAGLIVDPRRPRSQSDSINPSNRSTLSSAMTSDYYNESGQIPWTPGSPTFKDHLNQRRPTSSTYSNSIYAHSSLYGQPSGTVESRLPSRGKNSGFFPGSGVTYRPPKKPKPVSEVSSTPSTSDWPMPPRNDAHTTSSGIFATSNNIVPVRRSTVSSESSGGGERNTLERRLTNGTGGGGGGLSVFPRRLPSAHYAGLPKELEPPGKEPMTTDLTWLNLGLKDNQSRK